MSGFSSAEIMAPANDHHPNDRGHLCAPLQAFPALWSQRYPDLPTDQTLPLPCDTDRTVTDGHLVLTLHGMSEHLCRSSAVIWLAHVLPEQGIIGKPCNMCPRILADLAVGVLQSAGKELAERPLNDEDEAIVIEALLAPMLEDNDVSCCASREAALQTEPDAVPDVAAALHQIDPRLLGQPQPCLARTLSLTQVRHSTTMRNQMSARSMTEVLSHPRPGTAACAPSLPSCCCAVHCVNPCVCPLLT